MPPRCDETLTGVVRSWLASAGAGPLAAIVRVNWNPALRTTAGTAAFRTAHISLNPRLLTVAPDEVERTLRHEAAHLLAQWRAGRRRIPPHGSEWQQACADLGISGEKVTHTLPFPRSRLARTVVYQCPACRMELRRVRPLRRPAACRTCCQTQNGGQFHHRFQLRRLPPLPGTALE